MRTFKLNYCNENLKSKIPGIFAYISQDGNTWVTHSACESVDGCYGKYVQNIAIPCNVNLCLYDTIDVDEWDSENSSDLSYGSSIPAYKENSDKEYLRLPIYYSYIENDNIDTSIEYTEVEKLPNVVTENDLLHIKIYNSTDCKGNNTYLYYDKSTTYLYYKGICYITEGNTYTYKTLMYYYYKYNKLIDVNNTFISFINKGIGKITIDKDSLGISDKSKYSLVPDYIYIAEAADLYDKYKKMKQFCNYYQTQKNSNSDVSLNYCCQCEEYEKMGGDIMKEYLHSLLSLREKLCDEFYEYSYRRQTDLSVDIEIPLFNTFNDIGINDLYENEFVAGKRYYKGDIVTYNRRTWICTTTSIEGYTTGIMNDETNQLEFDETQFTLISELGENEWYYDENTNGKRFKIWHTEKIVPAEYNGDYIKVGEYFYKWNSINLRYEIDIYKSRQYVINGTTDSKLISLRNYKNYINELGVSVQPSDAEDFLYYYRKYNVNNINTIKDEDGNISHLSNMSVPQNVGDIDYGLYAYGDSIIDITYSIRNHTITFQYVIGGHLTATYDGKSINSDDGTVLYYYSNFRYDEYDNHGIVYSETYTYDFGSDIDKLINNNDFDNFIKYGEDGIDDFHIKYGFPSFSFNLSKRVVTANFRGLNKEFTDNVSIYSEQIDNNELEYTYMPIIRNDVMTGITDYSTKNNIFISRNGSANERFMRLCDAKTLEDIEQMNGGFFSVKEF